MNRILILLSVFVLSGVTQIGGESVTAARVECIHACPFEERCVREAVPQVIRYYRELGFDVPEHLQVKFVFQSVLQIHGEEIDYALGIFDPGSTTVFMCSHSAPAFSESRMFGCPGSKELYRSIIVHETAHFINSVIAPGLHPTLDEAVAATVQFSLMDERLREKIFSTTAAPLFGSYRDISMAAYLYGPEGFLVACYTYLDAHPPVLKRCLSSKGPMVKDPFLIEWN